MAASHTDLLIDGPCNNLIKEMVDYNINFMFSTLFYEENILKSIKDTLKEEKAKTSSDREKLKGTLLFDAEINTLKNLFYKDLLLIFNLDVARDGSKPDCGNDRFKRIILEYFQHMKSTQSDEKSSAPGKLYKENISKTLKRLYSIAPKIQISNFSEIDNIKSVLLMIIAYHIPQFNQSCKKYSSSPLAPGRINNLLEIIKISVDSIKKLLETLGFTSTKIDKTDPKEQFLVRAIHSFNSLYKKAALLNPPFVFDSKEKVNAFNELFSAYQEMNSKFVDAYNQYIVNDTEEVILMLPINRTYDPKITTTSVNAKMLNLINVIQLELKKDDMPTKTRAALDYLNEKIKEYFEAPASENDEMIGELRFRMAFLREYVLPQEKVKFKEYLAAVETGIAGSKMLLDRVSLTAHSSFDAAKNYINQNSSVNKPSR